jgi:Tol biopolymer transport system component
MGGSKYMPLFSPDGSTVSFSSADNNVWNIYLVSASGGAPETICDDCGIISDWTADGRYVTGNDLPGRLWLMDLRTRRMKYLLNMAEGTRLSAGTFSPDENWIRYLKVDRNPLPTSYIAPIREGGLIQQEHTILAAQGNLPRWSPAGNFLYGWSQIDGFMCLWTQRLDPATKQPLGPLKEIFHLHDSRRSLGNEGEFEISIRRNRLVFSIRERSSNIWMAEWKE